MTHMLYLACKIETLDTVSYMGFELNTLKIAWAGSPHPIKLIAAARQDNFHHAAEAASLDACLEDIVAS